MLQPETSRNIKERDLERASLGTDPSSDATAILKELFCTSAFDLATAMQDKLDDVGVLYENILVTGTAKRRLRRWAQPILRMSSHSARNGSGQMLFFVRKVSRVKAQGFQSAGFRFATLPHVLAPLAESMEVTKEQLRSYMEDMRTHNERKKLLEEGVHLACFAVRPLLQRGFDILVCRQAKNMIPTVKLPISKLEDWQTEMLKKFDNQTVAECLDTIDGIADSLPTLEEHIFIRRFAEAVATLAIEVSSNIFQDARLCAKRLRGPCAFGNPPTVIAFRVIVDAHLLSIVNDNLMFSSSKLFFAQQHAFKGSAENEDFNRYARQDLVTRIRGFGYRFSASGPRFSTKSTKNRRRSSRVWPFLRGSDTSSMTGLIGTADSSSSHPQVHCTNEIHVDIQENVPALSTDTELIQVCSNGYSGSSVSGQTFAEALMSITMSDYRSSTTP